MTASRRPAPQEESLDPQDWSDMRALGHRMVDDMMTYLQSVAERPVWEEMPDEVRRVFERPLPLEPEGEEAAYHDFRDFVLPYPLGNIHPRFWGWVNGTGTPLGALAEMLAATVNPNVAGFDQAAALVERQVVDWLKEMLGYPAGASGLLVSGGSMANALALAVARNTGAGFDVRRDGVQQTGDRRLVLYASQQTHSSVQKGVELLGLGSEALRLLPVGADLCLDPVALEERLRDDRRRGLRPFCIIGNAGTVNSGAIDDLNRLADLCAREKVWFHVDGAFGALAALSPALRPLLTGMERADSLAFDLHKWMYLPYEVGCVLVRRPDDHRNSFALVPEYLIRIPGGPATATTSFADLGIQLSRGFRALKVWMALKADGVRKYGRLIQQNVDQAEYLAGLVKKSDDLELTAPAPLNIVCFRYTVSGRDDGALNDLNRDILVRLQESGVALPSYTTIDGRFCVRVAITNHRTRRADLDLLVAEVLRLGASLGAGGDRAPSP
jgi:glutamate/tyrosine decarboxylase-like PLP-dependent enzyme